MNKKQAIKAINDYKKNGAGHVIAAYIYRIERGKWETVCHCIDNIGHIYIVKLFPDGEVLFCSYNFFSDEWLSSIEGDEDRFKWIIPPNGTYCKLGYCDEFILINTPE